MNYNIKKIKLFLRLIVSCFIFVFFYFNTINVSVIQNNVFGEKQNDIFNGIKNVSWESSIADLSNKNYVSSYNNINEYFSLTNFSSPFKTITREPDNVFIGYYFDKLQTIQYIYYDSLMYYKIQDELTNQTGQIGETKKIDKETEVTTWCNYKSSIYIVIYKIATSEKNTVILALANKKLIQEQLNYNQKSSIPTSICYQNEK